jgi:hypothetical protein
VALLPRSVSVVELIRVVLLGGFRVDDNTIGLEQAKITPQLDSKKVADSSGS